MVYDVKGWAWHRKAIAIQKMLNNDFQRVSIVSGKEFHKGLFAKYNHVHMFGWTDKKGCAGKYKGHTAGVSSHNFIYLHPGKAKKYLPRYSALTATSMLIYNELKQRKLNSNIHYCPNGVDETEFTPGPKRENLDKFVVGWSGQPSGPGFSPSEGLDAHGYHNILLPLLISMKDEKDIHFQILDRTHKNAKPWNKIPDWYRNCDVFLHTGYCTGTPNPLFEAAACGVPGISTAIGAAPELIEGGINGYIVPRFYNKQDAEARVDEIRHLILKMKADVEHVKVMSKKARMIIEENWTWRIRAQAWKEVFLKYRKKI